MLRNVDNLRGEKMTDEQTEQTEQADDGPSLQEEWMEMQRQRFSPGTGGAGKEIKHKSARC